MSENNEKVCEICSQEIPGDNQACVSDSDDQNTEKTSVICSHCSYDLTIKTEEFCIKDEEDIKPLELVELQRDIPVTIEVPCQSNLLYCFDCGYSTISKKLLIKHVKSHKRFCIKVEAKEVKSFEYVVFNTDIPKIIEMPCPSNVIDCFDCSHSTIKMLLLRHDKSHKDNCVTKTHHKCDYSCTQPCTLKEHICTHSSDKHFKCNVCDYCCEQSGHLKQHMLIHTCEKPYKCNVCDYSYRQSDQLKQHMMIHTGEKSYKCGICDYSCGRCDNLKRHMLKHTGEKSYKCEICDYCSGRSDNLKRHMLNHNGENPYKCNRCHYSCTSLTKFKRHKYKHTTEKPSKCNV